jgi:EmrB/QacA subfamily drug resistance transporter
VTETVPSPAPQRAANPWLSLVAVALGVMMVGLDGTVVGVANPTIAKDLDASLAGLQWVTNGYLLALAVLLIVGGKLGDRYGRKKVFIVGIVLFALTSLGCALSSTIEQLIAFRVLQGVGGALLLPNTLAILRASFPPEQLNQAVGAWGGSSAIAVASGPIIGGLLVENVSWESIFLLNLPLGLLAAIVAARWVTESKESTASSSFDVPGVALLSGGLFLVIWALIKAQDHGWGSAYVLGFAAVGLLLLVGFGLRERSTREPLLPLDLFANRSLSAGVVLIIVAFFALFGVLFFIGLYLQNVHGYSPVATGVRLLPLTATFAISAPLGGVLTQRFGPRAPLFAGMLILIVCFIGLSDLSVDSSYNAQWPFYFGIGLAMGMIIVASTEAVVGNAPVDQGGIAGGLQSTANQLGGVLGTAVLGSVLVSAVGSSLMDNLLKAGVPRATATQVAAQKELVGQGVAPVTPDMSASVAHAVTDASFAAFMDGLHAAMHVSIGLAVVGALLALLVGRGHGAGDGVAHVGV